MASYRAVDRLNALFNPADFETTIPPETLNALNDKAPLNSPTFTGTVSISDNITFIGHRAHFTDELGAIRNDTTSVPTNNIPWQGGSPNFVILRTITVLPGTYVISASLSVHNVSGTSTGGIITLFNQTSNTHIQHVFDEFPNYAYSSAPIVKFVYFSVNTTLELRAQINQNLSPMTSLIETYLQAIRIA